MKTREELENLINGSPLFSTDRTKDAELFVAIERRFVNDLAELMSIVRKDFEEIGYEIIRTAKACIKAYKTENGAFLNYYNSALKILKAFTNNDSIPVIKAKDNQTISKFFEWVTISVSVRSVSVNPNQVVLEDTYIFDK